MLFILIAGFAFASQINMEGFDGSFTYTPDGQNIPVTVSDGSYFKVSPSDGDFTIYQNNMVIQSNNLVFDAKNGIIYAELVNGRYYVFNSQDNLGSRLEFTYTAANNAQMPVDLHFSLNQGIFTYTPNGQTCYETVDSRGYLDIFPSFVNNIQNSFLSLDGVTATGRRARYAIMAADSLPSLGYTRSFAQLRNGKWQEVSPSPIIEILDITGNPLPFPIILSGTTNTN